MANSTPGGLDSSISDRQGAVRWGSERLIAKFDPVTGERAFGAIRSQLEALQVVQQPNCDVAATVICTAALVAAARKRQATFDAMPGQFITASIVNALEQAAMALFYTDFRASSAAVSASRAKVPVAVVDAATAKRALMISVLEYHFADDPRMLAELTDIRLNTGYADLAKDLSRLAAHYGVHKDRLSVDRVRYNADDEAAARGFANEILSSLHVIPFSEASDMRNRAWTHVNFLYGEIKAAADFMFRNSPKDLAEFPSLRTAALAIASRAPSKEEPAPPVAVAPPSSPTGSQPAAPTVPGMPGGNPLTG